MSRQLVNNIMNQTKTLLFNLKITLHTCQINDVLFNVPIGQRLYYNMHSLDVPSEKVLSRVQLEAYFSEIENKIMQYLNQLDDSMLAEKPENCPYTRLELILGQYRHLMYQIGIINIATTLKTNKQPKIIGMLANFPDEDHYYESKTILSK